MERVTRRQFESQQALTLERLKARIPNGCPLLVERRPAAEAWREFSGFRAHAPGCEQSGRAQVVAAFIDGYVACWEQLHWQRVQGGARMWTYRIVKRTWPAGEVTVGVYEAYDDGDRERPHSISAGPVPLSGTSLEELRASHARMAQAFAAPVLDYAAFAPAAGGGPAPPAIGSGEREQPR
jgi:hypothetical protein